MIYKGQELEEYIGISAKNLKNLTGKIIGGWYVICRAPNIITKTQWSSTYWAECVECNTIKIKRPEDIKRSVHGCVKCSALKRGKENQQFYKEIPIRFWKSIITCANKRKIKFNISIEDAWKLYLKQNRKCALSGIDIGFCTSKIKRNSMCGYWYLNSASLDRIDSNKEYTINNCQWVYKLVNRMKSDIEQKEFIYLCERISSLNKKESNGKTNRSI